MHKLATTMNQRIRPAGAWMRVLITVLPTVLLLSATVAAFLYLDRRETERVAQVLKIIGTDYVELLDRRIQVTLTILNTTAGFFAGSVEVSRAEFHEFVESASIQNYGIQAIEWVPRVLESERAAYEAAARSDGLSNFTIYEEDPSGKFIPAPKHEEYFPVFYVEPFTGNEAAFGLDLNSNAVRRVALERARDSNKLVATALIRLVQETGTQVGFLIFQPMYAKGMPASTLTERRQHLAGFTMSVFRVSDLVENALGGIARQDVAMRLVDTGAAQGQNLLYEDASFSAALKNPGSVAMRWVTTLNVPGRTWRVDIVPTPEFFTAHQSLADRIVLASGLLIATLVQMWISAISGRSARIERVVIERTKELLGKTVLLEAQLDSTLDGILVVDNEGKKVLQNQRCIKLWKIPQDIVTSDDDEKQVQFIKSKVKNPEAFTKKVMHLYSHPDEISRDEVELTDGTILDRYSSPVKDKDGTHHGRIWAFRDITERKLAEERQRNLASAIEQTDDAVLITDPDGIIEYVNPAYERSTGYTRAEALGNKPSQVKSGLHDKAFFQNLWQTIQSGEAFRGVFTNRRKNGELFYEEKTITPLKDELGNITHYVSTAKDITGRKRAEEERLHLQSQLQQAQKMEAIGQLTGGIAHDFNNILTSILGFSDLAITHFATDQKSKPYQYLREIQIAGERARDLVAKMLTFSRGAKIEVKSLQIAPMVKEVVQTLRSILPASIELTCRIGENVPAVMMDEVQLHQILMNLCINARDALEGQGNIEISLHHRRKLRFVCDSCHRDLKGDFVELVVKDDGQGIPEEVLPRIFEPFFTTKEIGKGTGMGLSMVHGIVHEHGGHIRVTSVQEQGSTFMLLLPVATQETMAPLTVPKSVPRVNATGGRILIVDDEPALTRFFTELLEKHGYTVKSFNDPVEALVYFQANPDAVDLVLTDQTMPQMTGTEMVQEIFKLRRDLPVILATGYSDLIDEAGAKQLNISAFLSKPIEANQLLALIGELLGTKM